MAQYHRFLACFGSGHCGRLGTGALLKSENFPLVLGSLVGHVIKQASCGGAHTSVVTGEPHASWLCGHEPLATDADDGTLFTFGLNDKGQLGHSSEDKQVPVSILSGLR